MPPIESTRFASHLFDEIKDELYTVLEKLGADQRLLATVGSWRDSLPDEEILKSLQCWTLARR